MKSLFPILLCLLLLPLTACQPDFSGSRMGTPRGLHMSYTAFHTTEKQTLSLKAGEEIALSLVSQAGTLSITIWKGEEEPIYEGEGLTTQELEEILAFANRAASVTCSRSGAIPAMPTLTEVEG